MAKLEEEKITFDPELFAPSDEPIFELEGTCNSFYCSDEAREETLKYLKVQNIKSVECRMIRGSRPYQVLQVETVYYALRMCENFDLCLQVKFLALELFDRFFMEHLQKLSTSLRQENLSEKEYLIKWKSILAKLSRQSMLRLSTCIQLASKNINRDKVLCPKKIRKYLIEHDCRYSLESIIMSEYRVGSILNYKLNVLTAYNALESLLGLRQSRKLIAVAPEVFALASQMLEMLFLRHALIYEQLFLRLGVCPEEVKRETDRQLKLVHAEVDNLWKGGSLILAALHFINISLEEVAIEELVEDLHDLRTEHELRTFSWVLVRAFIAEQPEP